jgi:rod shape-determining protein MreC
MGVISSDGVVGIIIETSENYSLGISLLNQYFRLSSKIKSSNIHGTIRWRGYNPRIVHLEYIPLHIPVQVGDTVITSSYSNYFPEGYHIGKIIDVKDPKDGQGFHEILVLLSTDFYKLENVYLVKNQHQSELKTLNQKIQEFK